MALSNILLYPTTTEARQVFEIRTTCLVGDYEFSQDIGQLEHEWETCQSSSTLCGVCRQCYSRTYSGRCRFQIVSDVIEILFKKCCLYFKIHMFRGILLGRYTTLKLTDKNRRCPLSLLPPYYCMFVKPPSSVPLVQHIFDFHEHLMIKPAENWFTCYSLENVTYPISLMNEIFFYLKTVQDGKLKVRVLRLGLIEQEFEFIVFTWRFLQFRSSERHVHGVGLLLECENNLQFMNKVFVKEFNDLLPFINKETNEIRMGIKISPKSHYTLSMNK